MMLTTTLAPGRRDDAIAPARPGVLDVDGLDRAIALGHIDIEPFDDAKSVSGLYALGFAPHDARGQRTDGERRNVPDGVIIEPGATATVQSIEFLELSHAVMARLWVASWTVGDGLRISAERLLPPRFRGRVCAYVTNIGHDAITLPPHAPLITVEVHFLSEPAPRHGAAPAGVGPEPSARTLEMGSRGTVADRAGNATVRIDDLAPMPFALRRAVFVSLSEAAGVYRARFAEADVEASGEGPEAAIANLKSLIVATYEDLADADAAGLDARARRQRDVLGGLLRYDGAAEI